MTHSSKSTAYARFIPREEIEQVSAWRFANVDGSPDPTDIPEPPPPPSPEAIAADMEAVRQEARAAGYAEGHADGHAAASQEVRDALAEPMRLATEQAVQRFETMLRTMGEQLHQLQERMAQTVLLMGCDLARQVVRRELNTAPQSLQPLVDEAIAALATDSQPVTVRLHPDDYAALEAGWIHLPESGAPRFVADESITPGGCLVQSKGNEVDATIEQRWAKAAANLGLSSAWDDPE
ncbi:MAG: flagellar assembly protein FliH [Burkholderiaceae bacterium]|nr:flagellar assembly protein FliH [Burkholderiaceae bacterium]